MKQWIVQPAPTPEFLALHPELPEIVARLLYNRNLRTPEAIDEFLNPDYTSDLHDPFLFRDMNRAIELIFAAIKDNKRITVHGDYDADGVCASAVIVSCLKKFGHTNIGVFLPHRETDGYGLNQRTVKLLKDEGTSLIITCDCGISNAEEVKLAKELGMNVIITDHHTMPAVFPPADAIIHPLKPDESYPDKGLAGGGVAFKLVQALLREHKKTNLLLPDGQDHEAFEKWLLDLVSISTVGDMVPLTGESRTIVRYGLTVLNKTRNLGLKKLLYAAGLADEDGRSKRGSYTTQTIGFHIAPRINAAGRMKHANVAFELLMAETEEEAEKLAFELNQNNVDRQKVTEETVAKAKEYLAATNQFNAPVLFALGDDWSAGILGIVAGRIKEEFAKPTFVMTKLGTTVVGSGRSIKSFNMVKNLQAMPELFHKFGGHPQACGFTLAKPEVFEAFKERMLAAAVNLDEKDLTPQLIIDAELNLDDVNWKLYDVLQKFEPFGQANEEPRYVAYGVTVVSIDSVGQDGKHLRLLVKHHSEVTKKTIAFGLGDTTRHEEKWKDVLTPGTKVDIVFTVGVNEWNGNRELQLMIEDIKKSA